jgi:hypothetical protein
MSTTPRLPGVDPARPATFVGILAHQPDVVGRYWQLYQTFWSHGCVDHPTKEVVRLRNARITDCGY